MEKLKTHCNHNFGPDKKFLYRASSTKKMFKKVFQVPKPPVTSPFVKVSKVGNAGIITLDRLKAKNAFNYEICLANYTAVRDLESSCKLVIHKSASSDVYSSGGDLVAMTEASNERFGCAAHYLYRALHLVSAYKIPYVALISGVTIGGCSGYYLSSKYRVATEKTIFAVPEVFVGNYSDCGLAYYLSQLDKNLGIYLGLTGTNVLGYDTKKLGIATNFVESKYLQDLENQLTKCESDDQVKKVLSDFSSEPTNHVAHYEKHLDKIEKLFDGESVEEIVEKLKMDGSDWSMKNLKLLSRASPTSLKVTHRIIKLCKNISFYDSLVLQFIVNRRIHDKGDLCEGARAFFIEKDLKPNWSTKTLEATTPEIVDSFFEPYKEEVFTPEIDRAVPENIKY